jgi:hypothetical protein
MLDFLDKESSIMGLLAVFCLGSAALVFERVAGATEPAYLSTVWKSGHSFVFVAVVCLLAGAACFHRQRATP